MAQRTSAIASPVGLDGRPAESPGEEVVIDLDGFIDERVADEIAALLAADRDAA